RVIAVDAIRALYQAHVVTVRPINTLHNRRVAVPIPPLVTEQSQNEGVSRCPTVIVHGWSVAVPVARAGLGGSMDRVVHVYSAVAHDDGGDTKIAALHGVAAPRVLVKSERVIAIRGKRANPGEYRCGVCIAALVPVLTQHPAG